MRLATGMRAVNVGAEKPELNAHMPVVKSDASAGAVASTLDADTARLGDDDDVRFADVPTSGSDDDSEDNEDDAEEDTVDWADFLSFFDSHSSLAVTRRTLARNVPK